MELESIRLEAIEPNSAAPGFMWCTVAVFLRAPQIDHVHELALKIAVELRPDEPLRQLAARLRDAVLPILSAAHTHVAACPADEMLRPSPLPMPGQ